MGTIMFSVACLHLFSTFSTPLLSSYRVCKVDPDTEIRPQANSFVPHKKDALWEILMAQYTTDRFLAAAVAQLSAAVKAPTETIDAMGPVGVDPQWESRDSFIGHLKKAFTLVHSTLELEKVSTYGLLYKLYTWKGSESTLKPLLLMGHYGENVWGRRSSDNKSGVIGILCSDLSICHRTAIEVLLEHDLTPTCTVVLSFAFDEQAGGHQ
ncbi:hypothetical protein DFH08DRAFT_755620, partial [Mycena albidolilacea]